MTTQTTYTRPSTRMYELCLCTSGWTAERDLADGILTTQFAKRKSAP